MAGESVVLLPRGGEGPERCCSWARVPTKSWHLASGSLENAKIGSHVAGFLQMPGGKKATHQAK